MGPFQWVARRDTGRTTLTHNIWCGSLHTVLCRWVSVLAEAEWEAVPKGFGEDIQCMADYFYAGGGIFVSTRTARLKMVFNVLTDIFEWVGLHIKVGNTVIMGDGIGAD